jgi:hypothetical protein
MKAGTDNASRGSDVILQKSNDSNHGAMGDWSGFKSHHSAAHVHWIVRQQSGLASHLYSILSSAMDSA